MASNWVATNELRWIVRDISRDTTFNWDKQILQQKWEEVITMQGIASQKVAEEWRDVPVVEEE
jgi:hypothetical protein